MSDKAIADTVARSIAALAETLKLAPADIEKLGLPRHRFC